MNTPRAWRFFSFGVRSLLLASIVTLSGCLTGNPSAQQASQPAVKEDGMVRGFAMPGWRRGDFRSPEYAQAIADIEALGANYVSIHSTYFQDGARGTSIHRDNNRGGVAPDLDEQRKAIQVAHKAGLKVLLKPHVNLRSGEGWRGDIGTGMTPAELAAWFESYDAWIVAHARLAELEHVEMFAVGTELMSIDTYEAQWRNTVAKVREVYHGPVVYCANHSTENAITWWDALDYIGIDAYYPLSKKKDPSLEELKAAWKPYLESCAELSRKYGKKILFTEVGYMSTEGTSERPYDWTVSSVFDGQEQADCYTAMFESVYHEPWFAGLFLWNWDIHKAHDGPHSNGYSPEGKPAEAVVRKWYSCRGK